MSGNEKVECAKEIHDKLEMDIAVCCKHQLNMRHKKNCNGFNQLFKGGEAAVQLLIALKACISHERRTKGCS